jgi:outer membrane protein TolC
VLRKVILIITAVLIFSVSGIAQAIPDDPILNDLIQTALEKNPYLKAVEEGAASAEYLVSPAGSLPDPMVSIGLSGPAHDSWVSEPMAMPNVTLGISQKFPFPGKLGAGKNAVGFKAKSQKEAYWNASALTVDENLAFIGELESVARERYKVGKGVQADVLRAQKYQTRLEDRKLMIIQMIGSTISTLQQLSGDYNLGELRASLPEVSSLPELNRSDLIDLLVNNNPDLKKSELQIEMNNQLKRKASLGYWPDITLGATYGIRWENEMFPMFSNDMLTIRAGFNLPLWAAWKQKNIKSSATAKLKSSEYARDNMLNKLNTMLDKNILAYERNKAKFELYKNSLIPQSTATLKSTRAAYEVGDLEFLAVITSQIELFETELELQRSLADALIALSNIEALTAETVIKR